MHIIDWTILFVFLLALIGVGIYCKRYVNSVADFLVAGRGVGKYLGMTAGESQSFGVVTLVAIMQAAYVAGLSFYWMNIQILAVSLVIALSGWGIYRLRKSRCLTINEILERRYSRKLRIVAGIISFAGGVLNMGIFPVVEGRFFVYFTGLPTEIPLGAFTVDTVTVVSGFLVFVSLLFCLIGGQVSVIVTDFIQGAVMMIMYIALGFVVYNVVNWEQIQESILNQPDIHARLSPFKSSADTGSDFGFLFFIIVVFRRFYNVLAWAPGTNRSLSAASPQEARLMSVLGQLRLILQVSLFFVPVAAFAFMVLPIFAEQAQSIHNTLSTIVDGKIQNEIVVTLFLRKILPIGLMGFLAASMLALSISTYDTYFLSWAGILVQDIIGPLRKTPIETKRHMTILRLATAGVALFVWGFSVVYRQVDYIFMFMAITGSIYAAGGGVITLGAVYWRRATTAGAWASLISGASICVIGLIVKQTWKDCPLNMMEMAFIASITAVLLYFLVSLLTPDPKFDLDKLLNPEPKMP